LGEGGKIAQTLYAHINKQKKKTRGVESELRYNNKSEFDI
jgi:hypothetical protein